MESDFEGRIKPARPSDSLGYRTINRIIESVKKSARTTMTVSRGMKTEDGLHHDPRFKLQLSSFCARIGLPDGVAVPPDPPGAENGYNWTELVWNSDDNEWVDKEEGRYGTVLTTPAWEINSTDGVEEDTVIHLFEWKKPSHLGTTPCDMLYLFAAGGEGGGATRYRVKECFGDCLRCRAITGLVGEETEGTEDVMVAKPWHLQKTPFEGNTINNITYHYDVDDPHRRTAVEDEGGPDEDSEEQVIVPEYVVDSDVIFAVDAETGVQWDDGGEMTPISLLEVTQRAWARWYV